MVKSKHLLFTALIFITIKDVSVLPRTRTLDYIPRMMTEDGRLRFPEIATKYGHPAETHYVITEDGYNLTLFHIPGDKKRAVLLVHGNTPTADCWIVRGNTSLAIVLARQGYDVWAINLRGNRYSRRHVSIDPDQDPARFFNYSFYEQGIYDLPATIDFILNETGEKDLLGIGHSVGTTQFYVMGSERPEYNEKIKVAISLAPICFLQSLRGIAGVPVELMKLVIYFLKILNIYEVFNQDQVGPFIRLICSQPFGYRFCVETIFYTVLGYDDSIEPEFAMTIFGHFPGGSTRKTFIHLTQLIQRDRFAKYDYGRARNMMLYNSVEPPDFDLRKVTMKSAIFVGREDFLSGLEDAARLNRSLPNVVHYQVMPYRTFNHGDFIWGKNMLTIFYPYLFRVIEKYI